MESFNISLKARCEHADSIRAFLLARHARFVGTDIQKDTYFNVARGRLKLRQSDMENLLIHEDCSSPTELRQGGVRQLPLLETEGLLTILDKAIGITLVVEKRREIYFIDNVKFHLDDVIGLGSFVEIEAIDVDDSIGAEQLALQCCQYKEALGIKEEDLLTHSYGQLLQQT